MLYARRLNIWAAPFSLRVGQRGASRVPNPACAKPQALTGREARGGEKQVAAMGNGSPTPAESISLKKLHLSFGVFILAVLGVAIRVVRITDPFIDFWSWRQSDVAMIAENFSRNGFHVFFPQINWAGPTPGYVGTEFQLVPLLAALLYRLFGVHEWIGRSVSVAFFAALLPVFFLVVRRLYTARAALAAVSVYIAALSMALVALYLFTRWLEHDRHPLVFTGVAVTLALALLVKPFIATVGFALLYLAIGKYGRGWLRATWLWTLATLAVLPSLVWYAHAYYVSISNPPYHFFGSGGVGLGSLKDYAGIAEEVVFVSLTPTVAVLASIGLFVRPRRPGGHVFHYWLIGVLLFLVTAARHPHQWYPLALVPVAAALAGAALDRLADVLAHAWGRGPAICAGLVLYLSLGFSAYMQVAPLYQPLALPAFRAGVALRQLAPRDALVAVVDAGDPTAIYYSGRKGWHFPRDFGSPVAQDAEAIRELETLRREGAR